MSETIEKTTPNRVARRTMAHTMSKKVHATLYGCIICKLPFIGKVRCQCKPVVKARTEAA